MEEKLQEMRQLIEKLNTASDAYYNGKAEILTDYEWDALFDRLRELEEETGEVYPDSPTNRVSEDNIAGQKEEHEFSALSLAKTKKIEDLVKWAEGREIWISWKLDGLTLVVTYDDGKLSKIVTRGNGHIGTNITHLSRAIRGIPGSIEAKGHVVIRGEAVISYKDFEDFLAESGEEYANPRNLASGSLTLKDTEEVKRRHIRWIPFTLVHTDEEISSWGGRMEALKKWGLSPVDHEEVTDPSQENLEEVIGRWTKQVTDRINPYPVDGLVIAYEDTDYAATGSVTGHHATRAGLAFKWADEAAETKLDHIEWSCAASTISPVAVFEPVNLEGTVVKRASLCNISECERLGIGGAGTEISVIKANKIIPKVIQVLKPEGALEIPDVCPVCGAPTEIHVNPGSDTKTLRCTNPDCTAKQVKKFSRFVSKDGLDIDGMSEATVLRFINEGWIRSYPDLYHLDQHKAEMELLDGFGEKSVSNLLAAVEKSRDTDGRHVLYSLCIPLIGTDVAKRLLTGTSLPNLIERARDAEDPELFSEIDGIGPEKSSSFIKWVRDDDNYRMVREMLDELRIREETAVQPGGRCEGLTFVVTGDVHIFKNRNELKKYIEGQGGKVTGSVSGSTDYLINNDLASVSSKNQKAKQLGIPILSEPEFTEKFGLPAEPGSSTQEDLSGQSEEETQMTLGDLL